MALAYTRLINQKSCIGNTLSTLNMNTTALDLAVSALSAATINRINFLSSGVSFLSSGVSFLSSGVSFLSSYAETNRTQINYVSANVVLDSERQNNIYQDSNGNVTWNISAHGRNVFLTLTSNGLLRTLEGAVAGQEGNLIINSFSTSGVSLTGYGLRWIFKDGVSAMNATPNAAHKIHVYYTGLSALGELAKF